MFRLATLYSWYYLPPTGKIRWPWFQKIWVKPNCLIWSS